VWLLVGCSIPTKEVGSGNNASDWVVGGAMIMPHLGHFMAKDF
jgi:hypothetical protein